MSKNVVLILPFLIVFSSVAQIRNNDVFELPEMNYSLTRDEIRIPDFDGYKTLKCDFHIHTVFSDGKVWPDVRVDEAWQQGLDAIAITDHLEYRPRKEMLKGDFNESYNIAKKRADDIGFILIHGAEITRKKPLGHLNALFISDANQLFVKDSLTAIDIAIQQGAFIMWNHPGWPDDKSTLYPIHEKLIDSKKIHGIEVFNHFEYYKVSFDWCNKYGLTYLGNSDIHHNIINDFGVEKNARPITLVFASEYSVKGIKDALFAGRTAVLFRSELAGKEEYLKKLVLNSLNYKIVNKNIVEITNNSDIDFLFEFDNQLLKVPAQKTVRTKLFPETIIKVLNCHISMNQNLIIQCS
jgi:predicted metal-dependent phosphoesterase TrpH